jgi:two-component system cell cycle response regulator DivK
MSDALILIVEDDHKNLKLARDVLQANGFDTVEAVNAPTGLRIAAERQPDLVLMDIELPGINGIEALKALRADASTAGIPVIAFTASVMPQDRREIMAAGFDAFLSKPIALREFVATVKQTLAAKGSRKGP